MKGNILVAHVVKRMAPAICSGVSEALNLLPTSTGSGRLHQSGQN